MKFLIIHDREEMLNQLCQLVNDLLKEKADITTASDYVSARDSLKEHIFDLVIVDLTIPLSKGRHPADFRAVETLLNELFTSDSLNIPGDVIGITQDTEAQDLVKTSLGPHLMITISEDAAGQWKEYLRDKITYARRAAETRSISINRHHLYDILIVTAMDAEIEPYNEHFEFSDVKHFNGAREFIFNDRVGQMRKGIAFSIGNSGQSSAASLSQALITYFRPKLVLMSGYCGGVNMKVKIGDLVFFQSAYAWDYGKWVEVKDENGIKQSQFNARPNPIEISDKVQRVARSLVNSKFDETANFRELLRKHSAGQLHSISKHLSPSGSGSAVVANDDIIRKITNLNDSIRAVDMECYGFYHAAKHTQVIAPSYICVKSVSDYCNGEKGDDFHKVCSEISAFAVIEIITKYWDY